jgi:hypothetical protein
VLSTQTGRGRERRPVDAINTFGVSAGHFASFGVLSRSQIARFRRSWLFLGRVRFPAAALRMNWSEQQNSDQFSYGLMAAAVG